MKADSARRLRPSASRLLVHHSSRCSVLAGWTASCATQREEAGPAPAATPSHHEGVAGGDATEKDAAVAPSVARGAVIEGLRLTSSTNHHNQGLAGGE